MADVNLADDKVKQNQTDYFMARDRGEDDGDKDRDRSGDDDDDDRDRSGDGY